ncbi:unnamed protein product [Vitrella brassicaformis CCMP3155]|uniref:Uncharacterized protein n=1 Tax=Vitrella brassicaformis (strain CCMP3155) TaxID=1169540 RepID=A0A0G4EDE0_VITBC|nr:unnamed protein product [Vitrella brassicaformis CCMP3155]|eukprot:CEL93378.1 unnamed protein product [Vitrella brassicaformis CCMP3155]
MMAYRCLHFIFVRLMRTICRSRQLKAARVQVGAMGVLAVLWRLARKAYEALGADKYTVMHQKLHGLQDTLCALESEPMTIL